LNDLDLKLLEDYFTIGINRAYLCIDPTILIWQDKEIFNENKEVIRKLKAIKFCSENLDPNYEFYNFRLKEKPYRIPNNPFVLFGKCGATGVLAVELAFTFGCNPIVLLGMDCKYKENKTDFYGINKYHNSGSRWICSQGLFWIASCQDKTTIITCNPIKHITNYQPLESVLASLKPGIPKGRKHFMKILLQNSCPSD
jgi:hypothetical protein